MRVRMLWVQVCTEGFCEVSGFPSGVSVCLLKELAIRNMRRMGPQKFRKSNFSCEDGHFGMKGFRSASAHMNK